MVDTRMLKEKQEFKELRDSYVIGSPATGDSSNMFLWILLLAASGVALTETAIYNRKK